MESAFSADNTKLNNTGWRARPTNTNTAKRLDTTTNDARTPRSVEYVQTPITLQRPMPASTALAIPDANTNHPNAPTAEAPTAPTPKTVKSSKPYATQESLSKSRTKMKKCRQGVLKCWTPAHAKSEFYNITATEIYTPCTPASRLLKNPPTLSSSKNPG